MNAAHRSAERPAARPRARASVWAVAYATLALPAAALAQETVPSTPVGPGQAESTADTLGTADVTPNADDVPVTEGQAEGAADALGGIDDEGSLPLGQQPAGTGQQDLRAQDVTPGFGDSGFLPLGQQPQTGGSEPGAEGQDLPDAELGARGVDVEGAQVDTVFPDVDRASRGVEPTEADGVEVPLEDVDLQARGVRLQGEQVNEELLDVRAEGSRGVEPSEGPRAGPREVPGRNVPGGGVLVIPGSGVVAPGGGRAAGGTQAVQQAPSGVAPAGEGVAPAGEGVAAVGEGVAPAGSNELEGAEELEQIAVTGTVLGLSYSDAIAQIATEEQGIVAVRARPQEIALLQVGDFVALNVAEIGDSIWMTPAARFEPASADVTAAPGTGAVSRDLSSPIFEARGQVQGVITGVNATEGLLLVGERLFQAHPAQLDDLEPGQMVSVSYGTVADEDWAAEIRLGGSNADETER